MRIPVEVTALFLLTLVTTGTACPEHCVCDDIVLTCKRPDIPEDIPVNVTHVYITKFNFDSLNTETFQQIVWENVTLLDLHAVEGDTLGDGIFKTLKNLESFGLHGDDLWYISPSVFEGLAKVRTLDLSNNYHLRMDHLLPSLDRARRKIIPSLENLILSKLNSLQTEPSDLEYQFMRSLSYGNTLKFLDISYMNIGVFDYSHIYLLCNSIEHIKAHGVALAHPKDFYDAPNCRSLRTLDMTDTVLPVAVQGLSFESMRFTCRTAHVYDSIETLIISGMLGSDVNFDDYHLDLTECGFHFKTIILRRNHIKRFNVSVSQSDILRDSISEIDVSENGLEFFAPEAIYQDENLQILRLSKNNLHEMQVNHWTDFARIFHKSRQLRELYIADNKLVNMPKHIFENSHNLEYIDLSGNRLQSLEFDIGRLKKLSYLDLANNWITIIDKQTFLLVDTLYAETGAMRQTVGSNTSSISLQQTSTPVDMDISHPNEYVPFQVNLGFNPYKCSCKEESYHSVEWLQSSKSVYRKNTTYVCDFQGKTLDILTLAKTVTKAQCAHQILMNILTISIPISVMSIILVALTILFVRRRQRIKQHQQKFLGELRDNKFSKTFLAFLSFCSEDSDFVMENLYPQMQNSLSELTKTDKNFICIGDREFRLGLQVHAEVMRCMDESSVAIFVVSKTFCTKSWCQMEVGEAYDQGKPIVMIMKEYVEISKMPRVLGRIFNRYTHASWINDDNDGHFEPNMNIISKSVIELARKTTMSDICPGQDDPQVI